MRAGNAKELKVGEIQALIEPFAAPAETKKNGLISHWDFAFLAYLQYFHFGLSPVSYFVASSLFLSLYIELWSVKQWNGHITGTASRKLSNNAKNSPVPFKAQKQH